MDNPLDLKTVNSVNFPINHPIRVIGKFIYNRNFFEILLQFLHSIIFCGKTIETHIQKVKISDNLDSYINSTNGFFMIGLNNCIKFDNLLKYDNQKVQYLIWVAPWFDAFLNMGHYIQIDASFEALEPYVYSVPLLIIDNAPIPLGI